MNLGDVKGHSKPFFSFTFGQQKGLHGGVVNFKTSQNVPNILLALTCCQPTVYNHM